MKIRSLAETVPAACGPQASRARWALATVMVAVLAGCGGGGESSAPVNQAPTATIDTPTANATFAAGETIRITATASDSDGTVAKVEFFSDGTKIGEDTTAPYAFDWTSPPTGAHKLTVRATDNGGAVALSAERQVTTSPANQAPTVAMTAPTNNFKANAGTTVLLSANAGDTDGTVSKVEFFRIDPAAPVFNTSTRLGDATAVGTPPSYQFTTAALTAGTYHFAARATDNQGGTAQSGSVQVIVNALPTITLTAPTAGANVVPGTTLTLRATASDADGTVSKVEFFLNGSTTPLGVGVKGSGNEYTLAWTTTTQGAYSFTARATDNEGATQTTASVAINVPANVVPTVTLDDPVAGTNAPTTLSLSASASDSDGSIAAVTFSVNGAAAINGTFDAATSKWKLQVPATAAGTYTVIARATDNLGGQSSAASKSASVAPNVPPAVNLTSSATATLPVGNAPTTINLAASASDTDGIAKVEFFDGATKLGEDTTAPYQWAWTNVAAGTYTITAKATDTFGTTATSTAQSLVVTPNIEGTWASLSATQKAGIVLTPNVAIGDGGTVAGAVMMAVGINTVTPKFVVTMAQGLRLLADLPLAVTGTTLGDAVDCPQGGKIAVFSLAGGERAIDLNDCKIGGFNFRGGGDYPLVQPYTNVAPDSQCVPNGNLPAPNTCTWPSEIRYTPITDGFRIVVKSVQVSGNGAPEALSAPFPHNAYGYAFVQCTITDGVKRCITSHENSFVWGHDLAWTNWADLGTTAINTPLSFYANDDTYLVNGTLRPCQADPQSFNETTDYCFNGATAPAAFHIKFDGMTNTSGRAIVYGSNGWSVVTRLAPTPGNPNATPTPIRPIEHLRVQSTIGGVQQAVQNYKCTVDDNGFYGCVLE